MSIPICGINRMMHGMGYMKFMQKPDAREFANQMINNYDKDGDGALNADELGKLSDRMMPMRMMQGMGYMKFMKEPDASEIANQMINNRDKDGNGALNADELGKLSDRIGLVEADFNEDGLIDQETLVSKISEKLEEMDGFPKMRGLKIYHKHMYEHMETGIDNESAGVVAETESSPEIESTGVVAETESSPEIESTGVVAETKSISDLVKQLLSQLYLSEEKAESFLEIMRNYGINVTA